MAVNKNREAELARQDDRLFLTVVEKNRRAVTTVIDFPLLPLPFAITALQVEGVFFRMYQLSDRVSLLMMRTSARFDCTIVPPYVE